IGRKPRRSLQWILSPAVFDRDVLLLDIAVILEALAKSAQTLGRPVRRCRVEEPNNRQRALLRASRGRPCSRRTAKQRDDLAAFQKLHSGLLRTMGQHTGLASIRSGFAALRDFDPAYCRFRSIASTAIAAGCRSLSAMPPKADFGASPLLTPRPCGSVTLVGYLG